MKTKKQKHESFIDKINKSFDKLTSKVNKIHKSVEESSKQLPITTLTLEEEWDKYFKQIGLGSKTLYPYKETRDIVEIYNTHKNHPAIQIPEEAKKIVDFFKITYQTDLEIAQKICEFVSIYIDYDNSHATASREYKKGKNLIYLNATETFNTRIGICGEKSLLTIGMLSYAEIPSTIYRPWFSHIAVIFKTNNTHYMCDPSFNKFEKVEPITEKKSKESHYEIGVSNIIENYKWNWEKRRLSGEQFGLNKYGRLLTTEELLDSERAHLCKQLKYGSLIGLIEEYQMIPECERLKKEKEEKEKQQEFTNYYPAKYYNWSEKDWEKYNNWKFND